MRLTRHIAPAVLFVVLADAAVFALLGTAAGWIADPLLVMAAAWDTARRIAEDRPTVTRPRERNPR